MHAIAIEQFGGPEVLKPMELPDPVQASDTILIRVVGAGVNPVDVGMRTGGLASTLPSFFPLIPGWDVAGVVEAVGASVTDVAVGDHVFAYARKDFVRDGTYAELVGVGPRHVAHAPRSIGLLEAAGVPLAGLTAYQMVHNALNVKDGDTVLVEGASGGVGHFATQLAVAAGARVIAVASAHNHEFLREIGASETIDYATQDVVETLGADSVDAVIDLVPAADHERFVNVIRPGGRFASAVQPPDVDRFAAADVTARYTFVRPVPEDLQALAGLIDDGRVHVHVGAQFPLAEAARAQELQAAGHTRGKIVLSVG